MSAYDDFFSSFRLSDGSLVNVHIMDTSGQERYKSLNENYYKKADACLLVYDITEMKSFEECKYYSEQMKQRCKKGIKTILLGNKTDLEDKRKVPSSDGAEFSQKNNYIFMETSCLKNTNVADAFQTLIELTNRENIINTKNDNFNITKKSFNSKNKNNDKERNKCF